MNSLKGKRALVTGSASGIGAAIVKLLRDNGAIVAGIDISKVNDADFPVTCDLSSPESIVAGLNRIDEGFGEVEIFIHAAAITVHGGGLDVHPDDFLRIYEVNVVSAIRLLRHLVPKMKLRQQGAIVFISSINADFATPSQAPYAASKAALNNLMKTLALELANDGIRVNSIAPASIDTPPLRKGLSSGVDPDAAISANKLRHPIARFGKPEEVASLAAFLVSDEAAWVTGAVYRIDGGASVTRR